MVWGAIRRADYLGVGVTGVRVVGLRRRRVWQISCHNKSQDNVRGRFGLGPSYKAIQGCYVTTKTFFYQR